MKTTFSNKILVPVLLLMLVGLSECNKTFPAEKLKSSANGANSVVSKKVLLIVVDGAVGSEVEASNPPVLNSLVDFSLYSWDALESFDYNTELTNQNAWSTLLTGVNNAKHKVIANNYSTNDFTNYPTLFTRIKEAKPLAHTVAYVSNQSLADTLASNASEKKVLAGDADVKNAVVSELKANNPQLVLAHFTGIDKAGLAGGYTISSNNNYKSAILTTDGYIGEILAALNARSTIKSEDWLIVVTSNKGSNLGYNRGSNPWSAFDDKRYNTFFFSFNPRFMSANYKKPAASAIPYIGNTGSYNGSSSADALKYQAKASSAGTLYDAGTNQDFTIQCKVKIPAGNYYYPSILGKRSAFDGRTPGYVIFLEGDYWQINFGRTTGGNRQVRGHTISDGNWHTIVAVVKQEGTARNVYTYTDGVMWNTSTRDITAWGNLNTSYPFTVGTIPPNTSGNLTNFIITDVRIYNAALSGTYISNNYCRTDVPADDPYKTNLIGFWPCTSIGQDANGFFYPDLSGYNNPLRIGTLNPVSFSDVTTKVCPTITPEVYKTVPNAVDVVPQIYDWLGVATSKIWGLDGKYWIPKYIDLSN